MLHAHGLDASLGNSYRADGLDAPAKQMGEASGCAGGAGRLGVAPPLGEPSTHFLRRDRDQMRGVNPARGRGLLDAWRECFGSLLNSDGSPAASGLPSSCPGFWVSSYWHRAPSRVVPGAVTATMLWPLRHCGGVMAW